MEGKDDGEGRRRFHGHGVLGWDLLDNADAIRSEYMLMDLTFLIPHTAFRAQHFGTCPRKWLLMMTVTRRMRGRTGR